MPYIPQFNKLSLQEQSYAPTLMRQNQDDLVSKQMELAEALKFDYLSQDAAGIEPVLQGYNKDIDDVSKQIAQQGFSHDIKNKVLGLRSKYVTDDKIRTYKKNYSDAMSQWEEQKKRLIQGGASGDELNQQKTSFFSGYKGAYDPEGFKQEFTAGKTSNTYNPIEDTNKLMKNLGETGILQGASGSTARIAYKQDPVTKQMIPGVEFIDNKSGQKIQNSDQIAAMLTSVVGEYSNPNTDRGLWAKITGKNQDELLNTITNVANANISSRYSHLQDNSYRWNPSGEIGGNGEADNPQSPINPFELSGSISVPANINALGQKSLESYSNRLAVDEAKKLGVEGITSFKDLKNYKKTYKLGDVPSGMKNQPGIMGIPVLDEKSQKAQNALDNIIKNIENKASGTALPAYNVNTMAIASGKSITELEKINDGLNRQIVNDIQKFTPIEGDKSDFEDLKNIVVTDIAPNFNDSGTGLIMQINATNSKDKTKPMTITLDPSESLAEERIVRSISQLNPIMQFNYEYATGKALNNREIRFSKKEYLDNLEASIPHLNAVGKEAAIRFLNEKKTELQNK